MIAAVLLPHASLPNWEGPHAAAVGTYWEHPPCRAATLRTAERYTKSLDAVFMLVGAKCPSASPCVGQNVHHGYWHARLSEVGDEDGPFTVGEANAPTPALALLSALLAAVESEG